VPEQHSAAPRAAAQQVQVEERDAGQRLDAFLRKRLPTVPKSRVYRIVRRGEVRINGRRSAPQDRLALGDVVRIPPLRIESPEALTRRVPQTLIDTIRRCIVHEDADLLVLDKPAGIAVHGGSGISFGVIEALRAARPEDSLELVHRLDRDTSGCLLVARRAAALRTLHALLRENAVEKHYLALLRGKWDLGKQRIDVPLRTDLRVGGERTVKAQAGGKGAISEFRPVQFFGKVASLLEVAIFTGRTHQIRVHAAYAGHPVAGDEKYGDAEFNRRLRELGLRRMFLHAHSVSFTWPGAHGGPGRQMSFNTPLPDELKSVLDQLAPAKRGRHGTR
jgi:23S rRNA pseudouridine955/2504/2580 synthase